VTPPPPIGPAGLPSVSIVIATIARPGELAGLIDTLARSTVLPAELIVIDQSQDAESGRVLQERWRSGRLVYLRDPSIGGASQARNIGIEKAAGDLVLFLDDDVLVEPDFIEQILATFLHFHDAVAVSGIITNYQPPPLKARIRDFLLYWGPFVDDRQRIYRRADQLRDEGPLPVTRLGAGLLAVRRSLLSDIRFEEQFGRYPLGEDVDLSFRLAAKGRLLINPKARLVHLRAPGLRSAVPRQVRELHSWALIYHRRLRSGIRNRLAFTILTVGLLCEGFWSALLRRNARLLGDLWIAFLRALAGKPTLATLQREDAGLRRAGGQGGTQQ
jgi:GT2 family glycosyltransferase